MSNLKKADYFDGLINIDNPLVIETTKQSANIILKCGCVQTQNLFCGKPKKAIEHPNYKELESLRFQFFEFCNSHKI